MTVSLLATLTAALIIFTTTACDEEIIVIEEGYEETVVVSSGNGNILTQEFWVTQEGVILVLFNGTLEVTIPEGSVTSPVQLSMSSFPVSHLNLNGCNSYCRGLSLEYSTLSDKVLPRVTIRLNYDLEEKSWLRGYPADEKNLQIYRVTPTLDSPEKLVAVQNCCIDCECNTIQACIFRCGFYVVGEN